jgi:hypothetical protein
VLSTLLALVALLGSSSTSASAGPTWSPTQQLNTGFVVNGGEGVPEGSEPSVGIDTQGGALVVWSAPRRRDAAETDVYASSAPPGQAFGPATVVIADAEDPALAVAADGRALIDGDA